MRVLVVRPEGQTAATARRLKAAGHDPVVAPILAIEPTGDPVPEGEVAAILVTSRNAVRPLAGAGPGWLTRPVFAVGKRTAAALEAAGFTDVRAANGQASDLARRVMRDVAAPARLLHATGRHRKPEPGAALARAGYDVAVWESYAALPVPSLPDAIAARLRAGTLDACLHYSRRSAGLLVRLAGEAGLLAPLTGLRHLCLSEDVAFPLRAVGASGVAVAAEPDEAALVALLGPASPNPDESGSHPSRSQWYARTEPSGGREPEESRTLPPMTDPSRDKRRRDPYSRRPPTIDLKANEPAGTATTDETPATPSASSVTSGSGAVEAGPMPVLDAVPAAFPTEPSASPAEVAARRDEDRVSAATADPVETIKTEPVGLSETSAPHAEVPAEGRPRSTHDGGASFEAPLRGAPQDELPGTLGSASRDEDRPIAAPVVADADPPAETTKPILPPDPVSAEATLASETPRLADPVRPEPDGPAAPYADPAAPPPRRGVGALMAAGLLGGVVGAGLSVGITNLLRPIETDAQLTRRVAALESRPQPAPASAALPAGFADRLAAAETAARTAQAAAAAAKEAADASARQTADLAARPALPADLATRVEDQGKALAGLDGRIADAGKRLDEVAAKASGAATAAALDELAGRLPLLQEAARLTNSNSGAITDLRTRFETAQAAAETRAREVGAAAGALATRTGEVETKVAALTAELGKLPPALMQAGLRIIAAGQASDALRAGQPVGPALAALGKLGAPQASLAALAPYATAAPPTAGQLAAEFKPIAERLTVEPTRPADTLADKVLRMADRIVTVRQVGDGSGSDVPGLVGRIEGALARGAFGDAATAFDALPESARTREGAFGAKLKARAAAEAAARRIASDSLASLDVPSR